MASLLPFSVKDVLTGTPAAAGDAAGPDALTSMWNNMFKDEAPDPWLPAMSRQQRVLGFFACLVGAAFCFGLSLVFLPMIYVKVARSLRLRRPPAPLPPRLSCWGRVARRASLPCCFRWAA